MWIQKLDSVLQNDGLRRHDPGLVSIAYHNVGSIPAHRLRSWGTWEFLYGGNMQAQPSHIRLLVCRGVLALELRRALVWPLCHYVQRNQW